MADLVTRKLNLVLLGKTLPSLIIGDCLLGSGIKFLILDLEDDKPSSPIENQYLWVDIQNHELTTRFIRSYTTPGFPKRPYPESAKSSVMLDQLGFTWFRHRYYINYLQLWKTFDCNDVFRKLGNLCDKMDCAENVFGVKWNQFETELDNVTVLEYLRKNCYLSSTVAWFKELASWFMNCDVSKLSMFWFVWCLKLSGGVETLMNSNQVLVKTETLFMKLLQKLESHIALCKNTDKSTGSFVPVTFAGDKIEMKLADYSQIETSFVFSFLDVKRTANIVKFDKTCYEDTHKLRIFLEMLFHEPKIDLEVPLMGNVSLIEAATSVFCHNNLGFARSCHRLFPFSELSVFSMRTSFYGKDAIHFFSRCIDQSNVVSYLNAILTKVGLRVDGTDIKRSQIYLHAPMPSTGLVSSGLISEKDLRRFDRLLILDQLFLTKYPNHIEGVILMALQKLRKYFPDCEISHDCVAIGDSSEVARRKTDIEMEVILKIIHFSSPLPKCYKLATAKDGVALS